jgi:hypothetical protein
MAEFKRRWTADIDAFAVMDPTSYAELTADGLPMTVIARDFRRVVVRKQP